MEVVVIGGGIVGASAAYHLARAGVETVLVDRADEGRATDAGAGILSPPTSSATADEQWFRFATEAVDYYPALVERLGAEQAGETGYARPGLLYVAVGGDHRASFEETLSRIRDRQERLGAPAPGSVTEVSPDRARDLFPPLSDPERAFVYGDAARVDGATFRDALVRAGRGHGLTVREAGADAILVRDGQVTGVAIDGVRAADAVVLAGGAWSGAFADDLGVDLPVEPMRGQLVHLDLDADTADWPLVGAARGHYLVPWSGGRVTAGATYEPDSGFAPRPTLAGLHEVFDDALAVAPGLGEADPAEVRVGLRPTMPDGLPVLGPVPGVDGAYVATGHGATGLQLGPYSGKVVADLVRGEAPEADLDPFRVERF